MKVTLPKDYRSMFTLDDLDRAKAVIACMKDDCSSVKEYAEMAIRHVLEHNTQYDCITEVLKAEAVAHENYRVLDRICDGSGDMDVWINASARTCDGFIEVGAYLSDIWDIAPGTRLTNHMFINYFLPA